MFLKQLASSGIIRSEEVDQLRELSIDNARKWLFEKVFSTLKQEEKDVILNVSVFNYPVDDNEVKQVITVAYKLKYLFEGLIKRVLCFPVETYIMYMTLLELCYMIC